MRAIIEECGPRQIAGVVTPDGSNPGSRDAERCGVRVVEVPYGEDYEARLTDAVLGLQPDIVCLAGFMKLLPTRIIGETGGRVINVHPALLPKHGGNGMYGERVHEAVIAAGDSESGCTVHWVTDEYDQGEPIVQLRCPVFAGDTPATLAARVLPLEHEAYRLALKKVLTNG